MHQMRKTLIQRLKSIIRAIRTAISTPQTDQTRKQDTNRIPTPISPTSLYLPQSLIYAAKTEDTTGAWGGGVPRPAFDDPCRPHPLGALRCAGNTEEEEYLPGPVWDALNPTERFASVADLCAHIGDQLPVQVVKLLARDVLRALGNMHRTCGAGHQGITHTTILLAPTDLRALISQLRAETQTSLRPSELVIGTGAFHHASENTEASAVFLLADAEVRRSSAPFQVPSVCTLTEKGRVDRMAYMEDQALTPPEALLGAPLGTSADIWTLGCIIFELLTGEPLFDPAFQTLELGLAREESHLIQIIEVFGTIPVDLIRSCPRGIRWFTEDGALRIDTNYYPTTLECLLERRLEKKDVPGATAFLESLLRIRPEDRARPEAIIDHPWFTE